VPERVIKIEDLAFTEFRDSVDAARSIDLCKLGLADCTATVVRYQIGAYVPRHQHTERVISIVLQGEMSVDGVSAGPGTVIECDGPYGPRVIEKPVLLLVIQPATSEYVDLE
jgi:hypothetical protein